MVQNCVNIFGINRKAPRPTAPRKKQRLPAPITRAADKENPPSQLSLPDSPLNPSPKSSLPPVSKPDAKKKTAIRDVKRKAADSEDEVDEEATTDDE